MNKKQIFATVSLVCMLAGCNHEPSFTVKGEIKDADKKMLYLEQSSLSGIVALDSVKLGSNGSFSFEQARPESPEFYRLRIENKVINFAVDSTETVDVKGDFRHFATGYSIEGSENNKKIKELVLLQADLQSKMNLLSNSKLPVGEARDSIMSLVNAYKKNVVRNYIYAAPNTTYAYFALFQEFNGYMIFDPINNKDDVKCFAAVATSLTSAYPHADRSRNLYNMVIKGMKNTRAPKVEPITIPQDKISETTIIDIPLMDINGNVRHLTDLKGKVVLIDFVAYGAEDAAGHNLALRELYSRFAEQGFEIFQVSLDGNEHFWKTASDKLPWICVRDPQGPYSTYVNLYGVQQVPSMFLVNRDNELSLRVGPKTDLAAAIQKLL